MAKANLSAVGVVLADPLNQIKIDHLRSRQTEIWTKSGSILGFDGLLVASLLVLVSGSNREMLPNSVLEIVGFFMSLGMILISALFAVIAINQNGRYPPGKTADEYIAEFTGVMERSNKLYRIASILCFWGATIFVVVLFSSLLSSGIFSISPKN